MLTAGSNIEQNEEKTMRFSSFIPFSFIFHLQTTNGVIAGCFKGSSDGELKLTQVTEQINNETEGRLEEALLTYHNFLSFPYLFMFLILICFVASDFIMI